MRKIRVFFWVYYGLMFIGTLLSGMLVIPVSPSIFIGLSLFPILTIPMYVFIYERKEEGGVMK